MGPLHLLLSFLTGFALCFPLPVFSQELGDSSPKTVPGQLKLAKAVMCEEIQDYSPRNQATIFSVAIGKVLCFTSFDPVPAKTSVYHKWFYRDRLSTIIRLSLQSPRRAVFSSIQLREADKGPWRVEIADEKGNVFRVLRFSITD